jgi:hypothetical protein
VIRSRLTWLLVGAVLILLLFAGLDALRSWLGDEDAHRTVAPTHQVVAPKNFAPCDQQQLEASIEVRGGIATTVLRHVSVTACHQLARAPAAHGLGSRGQVRLAQGTEKPV